MSDPLRIAFLGCGFLTGVHSRNLRRLRGEVVTAYASRSAARAAEYCRRYGGVASYDGYDAALSDPNIEAVIVAVPPKFHLDITLRALDAGKHVLVEKPAFLTMADYLTAKAARDRAGRVVIVGENDHYKPLATCLRALLAEGVIGEMVLAHVLTVANRPKRANDWRNDETMAGGDAFFEEGIHWLHFINNLGPKITHIQGFKPTLPRVSPDVRVKSLLTSFHYDNGAVGSLYYSREIPSLLQGLRTSKLMGREGIITFESAGGFVFVRGRGRPRLMFPGWGRDVRGYQAMYRDFARAIRTGSQPEMSIERAIEDQRLMEIINA